MEQSRYVQNTIGRIKIGALHRLTARLEAAENGGNTICDKKENESSSPNNDNDNDNDIPCTKRPFGSKHGKEQCDLNADKDKEEDEGGETRKNDDVEDEEKTTKQEGEETEKRNEEEKTKNAAQAQQQQQQQQQQQLVSQLWTKNYGALILFFEEHGHTAVPPYEKYNALYQWVEEQRSKVGALTQQQVRQLLIFNFQFDDQPWTPGRPWHCKVLGCTKFAAFNGYCHGHFMKPTASILRNVETTTERHQQYLAKVKGVRLPKVEFPLIGLRKKKNGKYDIDTVKEKEKDITRIEVITRLTTFLSKLSNQSSCVNKRTRIATVNNCNCMKFLLDKSFITESVAHALMDYFDLNHLQRKHYTVERLRYAEMGKTTSTTSGGGDSSRKRKLAGLAQQQERIFSLPLSYEYFERHHMSRAAVEEEEDGDEDGDEDGGGHCQQDEEEEENNANKQQIIGQAFRHRICTHAFHTIHNIGSQARSTLNKYANGDLSVGQHSNKGRTWAGSKKFSEGYDSMRDSLNALMEEQRAIQRLGPEDDVVLPLHLSRRKCYEQWSRERGWVVTKKNIDTGQYDAPENWEVVPGFYRSEEEALADGASGGDLRKVAKLAISWTVYSKFWIAEFPQLKTQGRVGKGMFGGAYDFETKKYYNRKKLQMES